MRRLIVLRPEPGATKTVERARSLGIDAVAMPLFRIEPIAWLPPDPAAFDAVLLTSANVVRHGGDDLGQLRSLPAYAVGESTAEAARRSGMRVGQVGESGIDALLATIAPGSRLLHLAGEDRREPAAARHAITVIPVYRAVPVLDRADLASCVAALHSPRAGARLAELVEPADRGSIAIVAISRAAAEAAGGGWQSAEAAETPNDTALLVLAARLCNNSCER